MGQSYPGDKEQSSSQQNKDDRRTQVGFQENQADQNGQKNQVREQAIGKKA